MDFHIILCQKPILQRIFTYLGPCNFLKFTCKKIYNFFINNFLENYIDTEGKFLKNKICKKIGKNYDKFNAYKLYYLFNNETIFNISERKKIINILS